MDNQNSNVTAQNEFANEKWTAEEIAQISGYRPEQTALVDHELMLERLEETKEETDSSENPLIRFAFASLIVGGIMLFCWLIWSIFFAVKSPLPRQAATPTPTPTTTAPNSDEAARLKAELAFRNQLSRQQQEQKLPAPAPTPTSTAAKPVPSPPVTRQAAAPPPRIIREPAPPPRIIREPAPPPRIIREPAPPARIIREPAPPPKIIREPAPPPRVIRERIPVPQPPQVAAVSRPPVPNTPEIDPFERWNQLATIGQQTTTTTEEKATVPTPTVISTAPSTTTQSNSETIPVVSLNHTNSDESSSPNSTTIAAIPADLTPGERGILNGTPVSESEVAPTITPGEPMQIQIGTLAQAKVLVPMIWTTEKSANSGRFAVELEEDVLSTDNRIAFPKGSILITEVDSVSSDNKLVNQTVVAVVYPDSYGQIRQQQVPRNSILIRGENGNPLIAKGMGNPGSEIARQDILIGLLGAAGRAAQVVNQNQSQSATMISSGGFSSQTITTTAREPNILAAAMEGFFRPMSQRLTQRADRTTQEISQRTPVAVVPQGTKVSVFFNTFFQVTR
ncbi:TrbI/VirB10 family protein [Floridanema aerugineum]|uniref:TrbI/VirB10 family protein n=1 Tax=Floridaenema aerugineum BLCC-F46 TaxID=3153654 RepID=A0ABV4X970_9CYAN